MSSAEYSLGLASGFKKRRKDDAQKRIDDAELARTRALEDEDRSYLREGRDSERRMRPVREEAANLSLKAAKTQQETQAAALEESKRKAHEEGLYDLVDELDRGIDPGAALKNYNGKGAHRVDPTRFSYDHKSRRLKFQEEDGSTFDGDVRQVKSVLEDNARTGPKAAEKPLDVADDHALLSADGKMIYKGPKYGKDKDASTRYVKGEPGDIFVDPKNPKDTFQIPGTKKGKGDKKTTPSGASVSPFNLQSHQTEARKVLAQRMGLKYDPESEAITGGKPGDTQRWLDLSAKTDDLASKYQDTLGAGQLGQMVNDAFGGVKNEQDYMDEERKTTEPKRRMVGGFEVPFTDAEKPEDFEGRVKTSAQARRKADLSTAEERLQKMLPPLPTDEEDGGTAEPPAVQALRAREASARAQGATPENPINQAPAQKAPVNQVPDVAKIRRMDSDALQVLRSKPHVLQLFKQPTKDGKARIVKFPPDAQGVRKAFYLTPEGELKEVRGLRELPAIK